MNAVVIVTGEPEDALLAASYSSPLLPVVDRPMLQHVVEYLVDQGFTRFDFIVDSFADRVEALLGDGSRWGSSFRYHLAGGRNEIYRPLRHLCLHSHEPGVLLVHADRLPEINLKGDSMTFPENPVLYMFPADNAVIRWTGWAWVPHGILPQLGFSKGEQTLELQLRAMQKVHEEACLSLLNTRTFYGLLAAQKAVLMGKIPGLNPISQSAFSRLPEAGDRNSAATGSESGIFVGRGVSIHPTARLVAPIYIGTGVRIGAAAVIGPNATIGADSSVGAGSLVREALLFPGTLTGCSLDLEGVLVARRYLINVRHQTSLRVPDAFLLGDSTENPLPDMARGLGERSVAILFLLLMWPLLITAVLSRMVMARNTVQIIPARRAVFLPASCEASDWWTFPVHRLCDASEEAELRGWRHYFFCFLPGLIDVIAGRTRIVGVAPRTPDEISELPSDWAALYLGSSTGLVTEAMIRLDPDAASFGNAQLAEMFYAANSGLLYDAHLLGQYFLSLFKQPQKTSLPS